MDGEMDGDMDAGMDGAINGAMDDEMEGDADAPVLDMNGELAKDVVAEQSSDNAPGDKDYTKDQSK